MENEINEVLDKNLELLVESYEDCIANQLEEEANLTNIALDRFKNDCITILMYKYDLPKDEAISEVNAIENSDYLDFITYETSTEDYVDELVSCWSY